MAGQRPDVRKLLQTTELWFILVANPDGYQYTFDHERLWRKNLRDNNGDGQTQVGDGVDPNRNFPNHWGYDEEGSSSIQSSDTYRGPAPMSEPETQAMVGLLDRIGFAFQVNYHSNGQWLLYAEGWQTSTPTADDPIYYAMSGNLDDPAIADFHPGLSSDVLYVTNGETTDYAHATDRHAGLDAGALRGLRRLRLRLPRRRGAGAGGVRAQPAVRPVGRQLGGRPRTTRRRSPGSRPSPSTSTATTPTRAAIPGVQLSFTKSYGDPQPVAVLAKRSLGDVTAKYRINGGAVHSAPTSEWEGGSTYDPASVYYHQMRGVVTGTNPGDSVEVWFEGGGQRSDVVHLPGGHPRPATACSSWRPRTTPAPRRCRRPGPHFADTYTDALAANGQQADVYDVDAAGRLAPDALGVLSHYDAVVWETGDDLVTRTAGRGGGNADRLALDEMLRVPLVHERGRQGAVRGRLRRPAVHQQRRRPALRPEGRDRLQPAARRHRPAALPAAVRLVRRW